MHFINFILNYRLLLLLFPLINPFLLCYQILIKIIILKQFWHVSISENKRISYSIQEKAYRIKSLISDDRQDLHDNDQYVEELASINILVRQLE